MPAQSPTGRQNFVNGFWLTNTITGFGTLFQASPSITADQSVRWLPALPGSLQALTIDASGQIGTASLSSSTGTVTSFSAGSLSPLFSSSVATATTTPALSFTLTNQAINTFFMGPSSGGAAAPTFRAIAFADLSGIVGVTANSIAAGNDSRFHTQNTDTGTTATSFQIDSGNGGPRLKNVSGALHVRNAADNAPADLVVQNLTVSGTTTTVNSETVDIADNIITLNSNVTTGTPTEDLGIRGLRGSSTAASIKWVESAGEWRAGLEGAELPIARRKVVTFTNANLTSGIVILTHGLGVRLPCFTLYDNNEEVVVSANIAKPNTAGTPLNEFRLDFTGWGTLPGTFTAVFVG
jgi:hypothetical protein